MSTIKEFLVQAVGKEQSQIDPKNPFAKIGFDGGSKRLGWVMAQPFSKVSEDIKSMGMITLFLLASAVLAMGLKL